MSWFSDAETVTHTVTTQQSNDIYKALDAYAVGFNDGPTRARLDRLLAQIGQDNRDAHNLARGERTLQAVKKDSAATRGLLAALPDPDDESFDRPGLGFDIDDEDGAAA